MNSIAKTGEITPFKRFKVSQKECMKELCSLKSYKKSLTASFEVGSL